MGLIYMISSPSGKAYVGQTIQSLEMRMTQHRNPKSGCPVLSRSIQKHGWENMKIQVLQECSNEELNDLERFYIEKFDCIVPKGMNCNIGGRHTYSEGSQSRPGTGCVSFDKNSRKFLAIIQLNGRKHYCGSHLTEEEGIKALTRFKDEYDPKTLPPPPPKRTSRGMGSVTQNKKSGKYLANIRKNGKNNFCGSHDTEEAARYALAKFKDEFDPENIQPQKNREKNGMGSVYQSKRTGKYIAEIQCNCRKHFCGSYATESDAKNALARFNLEFDPSNPPPPPKKRVARGMGSVWLEKQLGKYRAAIQRCGKLHRLGLFPTEAAAREALETFKASLSGDPPIATNIANN